MLIWRLAGSGKLVLYRAVPYNTIPRITHTPVSPYDDTIPYAGLIRKQPAQPVLLSVFITRLIHPVRRSTLRLQLARSGWI